MEQKNFEQWNGFTAGDWQKEINVRDFILKNIRSSGIEQKKIMVNIHG